MLIFRTFKTFNNQEYFRKSAIEDYLNRYNPKKNSLQSLYENFQKNPIFYVVIDCNRIIGIIRGRADKIVNLFIDGRYHKKGIGRLLINNFEKEAKRQKSKEIKTRSSIYAVSFYEKMGYKKTTEIRNFHGLKIYPMKKILEE